MSTQLPIACSLSAGELTDRLAQMAELGRDALLDTEMAERGATLRFAAGRGIRQRLTEIVAAESECCAFLTMAIRDEPHALALTITAPEGGEPSLLDLVDAFRGRQAAAG